MNRADIIAASKQQEAARIRFLEGARGREAACVFAERTRAIYRQAVLARSAPAGEPVYRLRLIGTYCYLKQYLDSLADEHDRRAEKATEER